MVIDWDYPEPRKGFLGEWDKFIGPGATKLELIITLGVSVLGGLAVLLYSLLSPDVNWGVGKIIVATILALDLAGGVVANASSPAKRWYHRKEQGFWKHMLFVSVHVYPILIGLWYRDLDWVYSLVIYGYLLISSMIVLVIPLYLRRPTSFVLFAVTIIFNWYVFSPTPGLEWFIPVLFLKILLGHIVKEEPYRPIPKKEES